MDKEKKCAKKRMTFLIRSAQCEYTQWTKKRSALKKRMIFCHSKSARQKAQKKKEVSLRNASLSLERCQRGARGVRAALSSSSPRQAPLIKFKPLLFCFGCSIACLPHFHRITSVARRATGQRAVVLLLTVSLSALDLIQPAFFFASDATCQRTVLLLLSQGIIKRA